MLNSTFPATEDESTGIAASTSDVTSPRIIGASHLTAITKKFRALGTAELKILCASAEPPAIAPPLATPIRVKVAAALDMIV